MSAAASSSDDVGPTEFSRPPCQFTKFCTRGRAILLYFSQPMLELSCRSFYLCLTQQCTVSVPYLKTAFNNSLIRDPSSTSKDLFGKGVIYPCCGTRQWHEHLIQGEKVYFINLWLKVWQNCLKVTTVGPGVKCRKNSLLLVLPRISSYYFIAIHPSHIAKIGEFSVT